MHVFHSINNSFMNYIHMIHASMNSCSLLYSKVFMSKKDHLFEIENALISIYMLFYAAYK